MKWAALPITIPVARAQLAAWHRRRPSCHACRWACAVTVDGRIVGVAFAGNPVGINQRAGLEVLRLATDGTFNACSRLQSTVDRIARAFGYVELVTYTDPDEGGASLKASGWRGPFPTKGGDRSNRPGRKSGKQPPRWRWEKKL